MLQVARTAPGLLRDSSDLVRDFVLSELDDTGGFRDRDGAPDLYYTVFGIECLVALREEPPRARVLPYLESLAASLSDCDEAPREEGGLDFVHIACLARAYAGLGAQPDAAVRDRVIAAIENHRSADGGWANSLGAENGTLYAAFLALGALQDLGVNAADTERLVDFCRTMETADGGYANDRSMVVGTTTAVSAACALLRQIGAAPRPETGDWLEAQFTPGGGFRAMPRAPMPDLLSTATALHALAGLQRSLTHLAEPCLDFIDTLWTNRGSFYGHWADDVLDCEYTYYGLLALGHLHLATDSGS